jgi:hypothetical protein
MEQEMKAAILLTAILCVGSITTAATYSGCQKAPVVLTPVTKDTPTFCVMFEYKVQYSLPAVRPDRRGDGGVETTSITPNQEDLSELGKGGWELIDSYLEGETAFAQLEKSIYPNQRAQRLVMVFKRALPCK